MVGTPERLSSELTVVQQASMGTAFTEFRALEHVPRYLGLRAHGRLEEILQIPVASDATQPDTNLPGAGQQAGVSLGTLFGMEKEFTRNLPQIANTVKSVAESQGIEEAAIWDEITEILEASGMGRPMYRTLDRPLGGRSGVTDYIANMGSDGIMILVRENIANWGAKRQQELFTTLGSLPRRVLEQIELIAYAGSDRPYNGETELWRPEIRPYVTQQITTTSDGVEKNTETTDIHESTAAELIHAPRTRELLARLGIQADVEVLPVLRPEGAERPVSGDQVVRAIGERFGDRMKDLLVVEVGNAPAGYTQLQAGVTWVRDFALQPEQLVAVSDGVTVVHPDHFTALTTSEKSLVQNAATGLNSFNGWLTGIAQVNHLMSERRTA